VLRLTWTRTYCYFYYSRSRGVTRGVRGTQFPGRRKVPTMSQVLSSVHLLPKDLILEHGGAKLASCHGCNLTLLRPWAEGIALLYKRPSQSGPREKFIAHPWLRSFVWRYGQPPQKRRDSPVRFERYKNISSEWNTSTHFRSKVSASPTLTSPPLTSARLASRPRNFR